jgi:hypothetical protein
MLEQLVPWCEPRSAEPTATCSLGFLAGGASSRTRAVGLLVGARRSVWHDQLRAEFSWPPLLTGTLLGCCQLLSKAATRDRSAFHRRRQRCC